MGKLHPWRDIVKFAHQTKEPSSMPLMERAREQNCNPPLAMFFAQGGAWATVKDPSWAPARKFSLVMGQLGGNFGPFAPRRDIVKFAHQTKEPSSMPLMERARAQNCNPPLAMFFAQGGLGNGKRPKLGTGAQIFPGNGPIGGGNFGPFAPLARHCKICPPNQGTK